MNKKFILIFLLSLPCSQIFAWHQTALIAGATTVATVIPLIYCLRGNKKIDIEKHLHSEIVEDYREPRVKVSGLTESEKLEISIVLKRYYSEMQGNNENELCKSAPFNKALMNNLIEKQQLLANKTKCESRQKLAEALAKLPIIISDTDLAVKTISQICGMCSIDQQSLFLGKL